MSVPFSPEFVEVPLTIGTSQHAFEPIDWVFGTNQPQLPRALDLNADAISLAHTGSAESLNWERHLMFAADSGQVGHALYFGHRK